MISRLMFRFFAIVISTLLTANAHAAAFSYYSSSASFLNNIQSVTTIDFENLVGTTFSANYDHGTGYYTQGSIDVQDVTFYGNSNGYGEESYVIGANAVDSANYQINGNASFLGGRTSTVIVFNQASSGSNAIGFDLKRIGNDIYPDSLPYSFTVALADGSSDTTFYNLSDGDSRFFGVSASSSIKAIIFGNNYVSEDKSLTPYLALDNVSFGIVSPVPEPKTSALMLVGFGLVGFTAYRRKVCS